MPYAIPTLGYPSRTAAVMALRKKKISNREIAARIGIPEKNVAALAASGRRAKKTRRSSNKKAVYFKTATLLALYPAAKERAISIDELLNRLADTLANDRDGLTLIDNILDDLEG